MSNHTDLNVLLEKIEEHALPSTTEIGDDGITRFVPWERLGREYERWAIKGKYQHAALVKALRRAHQAFKKVLNDSCAGCHNGDCLYCGSVNEIADHGLREITAILQASSEPNGEKEN